MGDARDRAERADPVENRVGIAKSRDEMVALLNELSTQFKALTAKLNADTGVTDADYETLDPTNPNVDLEANIK